MTSPMRRVGRGLEHLALGLAVLAAGCMVAIAGLIVTSVVLRKVFSTPLYFTEEVVGILMSVALFLALPMVTLRGDHIRVSLLSDWVRKGRPALHRATSIVALLVGAGFCLWIVLESLPWLEFAIRRNLKTETARILLYPGMLVLPVSLSMMMLILIGRELGWVAPAATRGPEAA